MQLRLHADPTTPRTRAYIQQSTASRAARRKAGLDYTLRRRHDPCRKRSRRGAAQQEPPDRSLVRTRIRGKKQDATVALTCAPLRMVKCRELTA
jgi:hypothetical protein